jgi:hypothetical protein
LFLRDKQLTGLEFKGVYNRDPFTGINNELVIENTGYKQQIGYEKYKGINNWS